MNIPFLDLRSQYKQIQQQIDSAISEVIAETAFISGHWAHKFEDAFSTWNNSPYCVSCANGTDAIEIVLEALGIGTGDEVIIPAMTWISTAEAVSRVGAQPIFVDVGDDACIDHSQIESLVTIRTRAVIAVHLYGQAAAVNLIRPLCDRLGLFLIEDCAQAHGAQIAGKRVGNWGHAGTFSFFPGKNLGAFGDAGCIVTNDTNLSNQCRLISNHGQRSKHDHLRIGRNSRMDGIQAAVLLAKLPYLDQWLAIRRETADTYYKLLPENLPVQSPSNLDCHAYHLFVVRVMDRENLFPMPCLKNALQQQFIIQGAFRLCPFILN